MKNILLLIFCQVLTLPSFTQVANEHVDFDNYVSVSDNDLTNYFCCSTALTQDTANGITGGSVLTPDSNNWGNDLSAYCSKYSAFADSLYRTGISFYYDPALVSSTGYDRAASIWIQPHADFNHYIITSFAHNGKIEINTYFSFTASFQSLNLVAGWYRLEAGFIPSSSGVVNFYGKIESLGPSGLSTPFLTDSIYDSITDTVLSLDDNISVSIIGAAFGGASRLDNFTFSGIKSADSCIVTNVEPIASKNLFEISVNDNFLSINGEIPEKLVVDIFDVTGKILIRERRDTGKIGISQLKSGVYFVRISGFPGARKFYK